MIVKKVADSKARGAQEQGRATCALWPTTSPARDAGGDGEKVEHRGALNLLNIDHDGQVQEMIDLAELGQAQPPARPALDHELAGG